MPTRQQHVLALTDLEARALLHAASSVKTTVTKKGGASMGWTGHETAAYARAIQKLRMLVVDNEPPVKIEAAAPGAVKTVLSGRHSPWVWVALPDGTLMLGTTPEGETYDKAVYTDQPEWERAS